MTTDPCDVPLEALLRRVSRSAESIFAKHGEIDLCLYGYAPGQPILTVIIPLYVDNPLQASDRKELFAAVVRKQFPEHGVTRYAMMAECWMAPMSQNPEDAAREYAALDFTLKSHPERIEVVSIFASDGTQCLVATRKIIRPAGGTPYLGKLEMWDSSSGPLGTWADLLSSSA